MGNESHQSSGKQPSQSLKLKFLFFIILTNLLTVYVLTATSTTSLFSTKNQAPISLLVDLNITKEQLLISHDTVAELRHKLDSTNMLVQALLIELSREQKPTRVEKPADQAAFSSLSDEMKLALQPHKLPLGYSAGVGSDEIHPPVGAACLRFTEELTQYMAYDVGGECPADDALAQKLLLKGCEPLPRRRCHPKSPTGFVDPMPLPDSLWTIPPDTSTFWDPYTCKNYRCLIDRRRIRVNFDCKECFDLQGREKTRWLFNKGLNYGIDHVLWTKPHGTIRIGLDIGGGTGTFAARMKERNVTIITTTLNLDGPFNSFIASRGLIPLHLTFSQRLPFFEHTLDIVHSMHVLGNWIPDVVLEFTLFDIYRVLRPGGLFWLDHFLCLASQVNQTYALMFDRIRFNKLRWDASMKLDRRGRGNEWYLSALLEKPMT